VKRVSWLGWLLSQTPTFFHIALQSHIRHNVKSEKQRKAQKRVGVLNLAKLLRLFFVFIPMAQAALRNFGWLQNGALFCGSFLTRLSYLKSHIVSFDCTRLTTILRTSRGITRSARIMMEPPLHAQLQSIASIIILYSSYNNTHTLS